MRRDVNSYIILTFHTQRLILGVENYFFLLNFTSQNEIFKVKSQHIIISKGTELVRVPLDCLMYVEADGNYSKIITKDGRERLVLLQLGQVEDLIAEQIDEFEGEILRLGRKYIINLNYIHVIDIAKHVLIISDCAGCYHKLEASKDALIKLKSYVETW